MYDTIIIGAGPAGMTAGIYAIRREMKTLIIGKELGGQMMWASEIENYPGFKSIKADDLISKMYEQTTSLGVEIKIDEVKKIKKQADESFVLFTEKEEYQTKTIIIAMGLSPRRLAIKGEEEFLGKGVTYCANCDGPFYRDKNVVIVGGGNSALDAVSIMSKIARKVYLVHRNEKFKAFEALIDEVKQASNVEFVLNSEIKEIIGKEKVEKIKVYNNQNKSFKEIDVDGVFIEIGRIANTDLVKDFADRNKVGQIKVDNHFMTKTKGVFACGDTVESDFKQITIACGQATIASLSAYQYIQLKMGKKANILDRSV